MKCLTCGQNVNEDDKFCKECGTRVASADASAQAPSGSLPGTTVQDRKRIQTGFLVIAGVLLVGVVVSPYLMKSSYSSSSHSSASGSSAGGYLGVTDVQASRANKFLKSLGSYDSNLKAVAYCVSKYYDGLIYEDAVSLGNAQDCVQSATSNKLLCSDASDGSGPVCSELGKHVGYSISRVMGTMAGQDSSGDTGQTSGQSTNQVNDNSSQLIFSLKQTGDVADANGCYSLTTGMYSCVFTFMVQNPGPSKWVGRIVPKLATNTGVEIAPSGSSSLADLTDAQTVSLGDSFTTSLAKNGAQKEWGIQFMVKPGLRFTSVNFYDQQGSQVFLAPLCFTSVGDDGSGNGC